MCFGFGQRQFEVSLGLLAPDGGKAFEEAVECLAGLEIVHKRLHGYAGSGKDERTADDVWVARDDLIFTHGSICLSCNASAHPFDPISPSASPRSIAV